MSHNTYKDKKIASLFRKRKPVLQDMIFRGQCGNDKTWTLCGIEGTFYAALSSAIAIWFITYVVKVVCAAWK